MASRRKEVPGSSITCRAEGHFAICPECGEEFAVPVTERENPEARFVLSQKFDAATSKWVPNKVTYGTVAEYDLSAYEAHYREVH